MEMLKPPYLTDSFEGHRTYYWIGASVLYSMFTFWFDQGFVFNSNGYSWFDNPYYKIEGFEFVDPTQYKFFIVHNFAVVFLLVTFYLFLIGIIWWKSSQMQGVMSKTQILILGQVFFICLFTAFAGFAYAYMQLVELPEFVTQYAAIS
ncbi:hypothetical protein L596_012834 [Steinernema carpocapsae]|uniref:Uncharacterized protein n=1 Tax=Steinernema carpocapsae TaxID=34508 RepID=A0A4V6A4W9_STECR|nr:hypothetical protein L596_012834 [Steinernema carpocapsae]